MKSKQVLKELQTSFHTIEHIQVFLDCIPYSTDEFYRCPARVMHDKKAHCFDGAVFASAALKALGYPPILMQLKAIRDDDHIIALFKRDTCWGALAKSNCSGLRFREPIYKNLRELALSYFEDYFNTKYEKTLRAYSVPLYLKIFDHYSWITNDAAMERIALKIDQIHHTPLITSRMIKNLLKVDQRSYEAGMLGSDEKGLYQPD